MVTSMPQEFIDEDVEMEEVNTETRIKCGMSLIKYIDCMYEIFRGVEF